MDWLFILGLGVWCVLQQLRLEALTTRLSHLELDIRQLEKGGQIPAPPKPVEAGLPEEPRAAPIPAQAPPRPPVTAPAAAPARATIEPPGMSVSDWLSENGLAWIGGGALALGGLMLVAYAAQRGLFTPAFRIAAAVALGLLALAAGERLRRGLAGRESPPLLVAALTTAAGAAILYGAIWAACILYGFIPVAAAAVLLAAVSLGLLALALLHGEALGLLAILAAYAVPVVSGGAWSGGPLDAFALLILATGLAAAGLRRWGQVAAFALAGAGLWALARAVAYDNAGVAMIAIAGPLLVLAASAFTRPVGADAESARPDMPAWLTIGAFAGSGVLAMILWVGHGPEAAAWAALVTGLLALATAVGVRARLASPLLLASPALVGVCAAALSITWIVRPGFGLWLLPGVAAVAAAGFDGARRSVRPREAALIGAGGAALTLTLAAWALARALPQWDWVVDAAFAAGLAVGAVALARRSADARKDLAVAAWIAVAAEVVGLALHASLDGRIAPTAYGALGLVLAVLAVRIRWRGFAESTAVAGLASFGALLGPAVTGAALSGAAGPLAVASAAAAATLVQVAAWRTLKARADAVACTEAVSTLAVMSALLGAFLLIQTWSVPRSGMQPLMGGFTAASLRTVLLLTAGLMLSVRGAPTTLGRVRGPVFLGLGAAHGLVRQGLILHPWWGLAGPVTGPPLFDGLLLGLLAPALLLGQAARRAKEQPRAVIGTAVALAVLFAALWVVTEIRRLFHGPSLAVGHFGYAETAAYGLAVLAVAIALETGRARLGRLIGSAEVVAGTLDAITWSALIITLWIFGFVASPWWGPIGGNLRAPALLGVLYFAVCALGAIAAVMAREAARKTLAHVALAAAGVEFFALLTLAIRYAFHGGAMRAPLREASLETWTFSAVWALYGLLVLSAGASRRDRPLRGLGLAILLATTAKVFLFDLARLEGAVRAASFLALGVALLIGALAARRFGATTGRKNDP